MSERGRPLANAERELFGRFFARLQGAGVFSMLLRNYGDFPDRIGHDLDVFFRRADLKKAIAIFHASLRESGGEVLHIHQRDYVFAVWFRAARGESQAIHLDFYHGAFTWHGLPYVSEEELVAASRSFGVYKAPRPAHEALNLFLTSLLWGGFFKVRYRERIQSLLKAPEESAEFFRLLHREFGSNARPTLDFADDREPAPEEMRSYAARLRRSFKARSFRRRPFATIFRLGRFWLEEFGTVISPPGICLAILGPDGSGKSTVIQAVKERLEYFFGETEDRHWRPHFLRDVGVLLNKREQAAGPVSNPHGRPPHSITVSALRFFYYWLDYWLGYPLRVWKFRAKNHLVIFDRYAQDMWCDPRRYRLHLPDGLMKFFCRLTPQPELTFVLLASAEVIHQRKGEVPMETLRELLQRYGEAVQGGAHARAVDCSRPVNQVADEIAAAALEHLKTKAQRDRRLRRAWRMETTSTTQPDWQNLFRSKSPTGSIVRWRVLRKQGEPLLVFPGSGVAAAGTLALYPAQTATARLMKNVLHRALKLNLPLPFGRVEVSIDSAAPFARFLATEAGTRTFPKAGIFAGNPRTAGRRFILLLFGEQNEPVRVVKAGMGETAMNLIGREESFLASAPPSVAGIPKLHGTFHGENLNAFAMEFLEGDFPSAADDGIVANIANAWVQENRSTTVAETVPWRELESACSGEGIWKRIKSLGARSVRGVIWHGDFAPWNMKLDRRTGRCVVFDWERGQLSGVPGWDWFHFVVQPGVLVKKLSAPELRDELEKLLRSEKFSAYAKRCGITGCERELALAYLLYNVAVLKPSEGRVETRALLELLTDSWTPV